MSSPLCAYNKGDSDKRWCDTLQLDGSPAPGVSKEDASLCRRMHKPMSETLARPLVLSSTLWGYMRNTLDSHG